MLPEIQTLLEQAERRYLQPQEMEGFRLYAVSLAKRLETYEWLRENEETIFQPIADQLVAAWPAEAQATIERALKHWLLVLRYCAAAMLANDTEFLDKRLLGWLKGLVDTHQMQALENTLYQLLKNQLQEQLSEQNFSLLQPFLEQANTRLLGT